jgi:uncharacterized protein YegL
MSNYTRRLPVYLLLDCSESMAGEAFTAQSRGLSTMMTELRSDPMALETAAVSLITFASSARQLVPLTDVLQLEPYRVPKLRLGSGTALGAALELWEQCVSREVVKNTPERKGDFKPLCFILTDGEPTDKWEKAADRIRTTVCGKQANVIAVGCGPDADLEKLRRITEVVVSMKGADEASFSRFFKWVSASVSTTSQALERGGEKGINLPNLPPEHLEVSRGDAERPAPVADRYLFLHGRCSKNGGLAIVRFAKEGKSGLFGLGKPVYKGVAAHPVDDFDFESGPGGKGLSLSSDAIQAPPPCPYCQNPLWGMCRNRHWHCCPALTGAITLTCPWCHTTDKYGMSSFGMSGAAG